MDDFSSGVIHGYDHDHAALHAVLQTADLGGQVKGLKQRNSARLKCDRRNTHSGICGIGVKKERFLNRSRIHAIGVRDVQNNVDALVFIRNIIIIVLGAGVREEPDNIVNIGFPEINFGDLDTTHFLKDLSPLERRPRARGG